MYKQYKKIKKNRKKKASILKARYLAILLIIIVICIAVGYSYWSTSLNIIGTVTASKPALDVEVPPPTEVDGVPRYSTNTNLTALGYDIYKVVEEKYERNTITTTIQHVKKQSTSWFYVKPTITLKIENATSSDYLNGTIELIEYSDANNIFTNRTQTISPTTVLAGEKTTMTIKRNF